MIIGQSHDVADAMISVQGSVFQMISHAFSSGALFLGVGYLHQRYGSLWIKDYQGIAHAMPILATFFMSSFFGDKAPSLSIHNLEFH